MIQVNWRQNTSLEMPRTPVWREVCAVVESQHFLDRIEECSEMGDVNTSYVSDHTKWIDELLEKNPAWVEDQKVGRALWWDKKQDVQTTERNADSKVPQKPYPYDVNFYSE